MSYGRSFLRMRTVSRGPIAEATGHLDSAGGWPRVSGRFLGCRARIRSCPRKRGQGKRGKRAVRRIRRWNWEIHVRTRTHESEENAWIETQKARSDERAF